MNLQHFVNKITTIRNNNFLDDALYIPPIRMCNMTHFAPVDLSSLKVTVTELKASACCLDPLPASFFKSVFSRLVEATLQLVNCCLQSGVFPSALKTAVMKPLLKKHNLDPLTLSNY